MKLIKSIKKKIAAFALIGTTVGTIAASGNVVEAAETYPLDKEYAELAVLQADTKCPYAQSLFMINSHIKSHTLQTVMNNWAIMYGTRRFINENLNKKNEEIYTKDIKNWLQQFIYDDWAEAIDEANSDENSMISTCSKEYYLATPTTSPYHFNGKYYTGRGINMKNTKIGKKYSDTSPMSVYNMPPEEWFEIHYQTDMMRKYEGKYNCVVYSDLFPRTEEIGHSKMVPFDSVDREKVVEAYIESNAFTHYDDPEKAKDVYRYIYSVGRYKDCGYIMGSPSYWTHK